MILGRKNGESTMRLQPKIAGSMVLCVVVANWPSRRRRISRSSPATRRARIPKLRHWVTCAPSCGRKSSTTKIRQVRRFLELVSTYWIVYQANGGNRSRRLQGGIRSKKDGFQLTMTPKELDAQHRSFYAEDDGIIHAEEDKAATDSSPVVK